ncbi:MFS general substrate transporter [Dacryopinax primogenitus]|uniref:MFS general substrate transporter n=1 Tax=Dacryopinax primogenitus (strain DJM 731) TaxID=1858805 RepID=M5FRM1_DACPD|nr:MFS general substrate transporter [Dacryopinax primogenitus]EJT98363.1 MFS general substrate transporter [Dacryopinax primogenitus]
MDTTRLELGPPPTSILDKQEIESSATPSRSDLSVGLPPVDGGLQAWIFVGSATALDVRLGDRVAFGTYQNYYTSSNDSPILGSSISSVAAIGTTYLATQYILGFLLMPLLKRYPQHVRLALWVFLAIECVSLISASFATQTWHLILLQGIIPGIAGAVFYGPALLWLSQWWVERCGLACGIMFCGTGAGGAIFPPIIGVLLQHLGFRWTLRIWALAFTLVMAPAIYFMRPRYPPARLKEGDDRKINWSRFVNPVLAVVSASVFIQALGYFPVSIYIPTYTTSLGLPPLDGQLVLSVFNICTLIGQVFLGWLCDKLHFHAAIIVAGIGSTLSAFLIWGFASNLGMIFAFVIVFGFTAGGFSSIFAPVGAAVFGSDQLSAGVIPGYLGALRGVAAIIGPIVSATLYTPGEPPLSGIYGMYGFGKMQIFVGVMTAVTVAGGIGSWAFAKAEMRRGRVE